VEVRTGAIVKILEFCSVGGARSQNSIFRVFRVPFDCPAHSLYRKQFYPKQMVPMESRDSALKVCLLLVWRVVHLADIGPWRVPKSGQMTITKIENLHIDTRRKIHYSKMLFFLIYDEK